MTTIAQLVAELDALENLQARLAAIATRTDSERRYELIQLRKKLSGQITIMGHLSESLFAGAPDKLAEFRRHYSAMRSVTALHQAEWPAVRLGDVDDLYRQSALRVSTANGVFVRWLREALARDGMGDEK